jgi:hypothetical protein
LLESTNNSEDNSRAAHIFYDHAQNIYGRKTPTWFDFGLDMQRRSTILRENFRSTRPILEFATNVLYQLSKSDSQADYQELMDLIKLTTRNELDFLEIQYGQLPGLPPSYQIFLITMSKWNRSVNA